VALLPQSKDECTTTAPRGGDVTTAQDVSSADATLELLMRQALGVPGAASALLEAFAAQTRALRLVQEADARGAASLPPELRHRLATVVERTPSWLAAGSAGVRA